MFKRIKEIVCSPMQMIPLAVFSLIAISLCSIWIAVTKYESAKEYVEMVDKQSTVEEWDAIESAIETNFYSSKLNSKIIAMRLEASLRSHYKDLGELEKEFDTLNYSKEFHEILKSNLYQDDVRNNLKTDPFMTLVGTEEYLIASFSSVKGVSLANYDTEQIRKWEDVYNSSPDPNLMKDAIWAIKTKSPNIIFSKNYHRNSANNEQFISMTMDSLKTVYEEKGLEALYDYSILAPAYITEDGDIFGTDDNIFMQENRNHKIMVIQVVDIERIIDNEMYKLKLIDKQIDKQKAVVSAYLSQEIIMSFIWILILFTVSSFLIYIHNTSLKKGKKEEGTH